ncbi:hypothetical protein [Plastoroseomonas hellenica]|uniref:hypothetical protein n=1 Tax=Plastoroseomonas hellenica TaxID=2687306 RepID=UPI001BA672E0|nr:hypothetical protein [Plastoroseomonas hellenica]MBR0646621.1 hypothetical protein [Plastoroseomonas hellenica]
MTDERAEGGEPRHHRKRDAFKIAPVFREAALVGYQLVEIRADGSRAPLRIEFPTRFEALEAREAMENLNSVARLREVFGVALEPEAEEVLRLWRLLDEADRTSALAMMRAAAFRHAGDGEAATIAAADVARAGHGGA